VSHRLRLAVLALGLGAIAAVVFLTVSRSPEHVRDMVDGMGAWAPLVFIPLSAALSCAFFPGQLLAGASGLLFGTAAGTPISIVAATLAATCAFSISRHGGRAAVDELSGPRIGAWQDRIERGGFLAVLYARIVPFSPFVVVNYVSGLTRLRLGTFVAATVIGVSPRAFAFTALGGHLDDLGSPEAIAAFAVLVVMGVVGGFLTWNGAGRPSPRAVWRAVWRALRRRRSAHDREADAPGG
jgi:uncharacterized membrane protein YdjX (TVP38/TMEM64 family)